MKLLLYECVPAPMQKLLSGHKCSTVQNVGWSGSRNGELLDRTEGQFDLLITSDQNVRYQQNLAGRNIAIIELSTNDIGRIKKAISIIQEAIDQYRRTRSNK